MKNNLFKEPSLYLQQHKDNPVNWQVWDKSVLGHAKEKNKPILLSIGYSSCHWCHVMAHESFEDIETAKIMNENFINIKVDREDRPDIDFVFQSSFQLLNNTGGGWPLNVFLDENGVPFSAGTYFPKNSRNGLPSFKDVLIKVSEIYKNHKEKIVKQSKIIKQSLDLKKSSVISQDLYKIIQTQVNNLDTINGGFKGMPKFPTFNLFQTILYFHNKKNNQEYLKHLKLFLKKICSMGIYDHVEGGICRYTVDENWVVPHFEKMLYDNAQFVELLSNFLLIENNDYFKSKLNQTINFLNKNFYNSQTGLLGTSYDADSDGEEGKYYTFTYEEIKNIENIEKFFDVKKEGNWENKIILTELTQPDKEIINKLLKIRQKKNKPFFDNKSLLDLNSIWISSLIKADKVIKNQKLLDLAIKYFETVRTHFLQGELTHCKSNKHVFIEDYAYLINCLLDLYDATLNMEYKVLAKKYSEEAISKFYLKDKKIFQKNEILKNDIFISPVDISDHSISNGNSIMLLNFSRLGMKSNGKELSDSLNAYLNIYKGFMISSLKSIDFFNENLKGIFCTTEGCKI